MNDSQKRPRHPKITESLKSIGVEKIIEEVQSKYNFNENMKDIVSGIQRALQNKCQYQIANLEQFAIIKEEDIKAGKPPTAKVGKQKEFDEASQLLNECQLPIMDKFNAFQESTKLLLMFSGISFEGCIEDCENDLVSGANPDPTSCIKECGLGYKYNLLSLSKMVELDKKNIVNSFSDSPKM